MKKKNLLFVILIIIVALVFYFSRFSKNKNEQNNSTKDAAATTTSSSYTMGEIQKHNSKENCWVVIKGSVYDLTGWINKHPGGPDKILNICGKDGTSGFEKQHEGQKKPEEELNKFYIGTLVN